MVRGNWQCILCGEEDDSFMFILLLLVWQLFMPGHQYLLLLAHALFSLSLLPTLSSFSPSSSPLHPYTHSAPPLNWSPLFILPLIPLVSLHFLSFLPPSPSPPSLPFLPLLFVHSPSHFFLSLLHHSLLSPSPGSPLSNSHQDGYLLHWAFPHPIWWESGHVLFWQDGYTLTSDNFIVQGIVGLLKSLEDRGDDWGLWGDQEIQWCVCVFGYSVRAVRTISDPSQRGCPSEEVKIDFSLGT